LVERGEKALKEADERDERNGLASHLPADLRAAALRWQRRSSPSQTSPHSDE
jgi:hypothetical protein